MLGWMIVFALLIVPGVAAAMAGYPAAVPLKTASVVFAGLLMAAVVTRLLRSRAH